MMMQAKRKLSRGLSMALAAILVLGMVLIPTKKTEAGQSVTVTNINAGYGKDQHTELATGEETHSFVMPADGTLELTYKYPADEYVYVSVQTSSGSTLYDYTSYDSNYEQGGMSVKEEHLFYTGLTKGQSYILRIDKYSSSFDMIYRLRYAPNSATLTSGKAIYGGTKKNYVSYYKISVKKNGYLTVQFGDACKSSYPRYDIKLLNAKKKAVTHSFEEISNYTSASTTFGVKKGTYYLAIKGSSSCPVYWLKATCKAVKSKVATKKAKAVTLKKGKTKKGVIYAKNKKVPAKHWYKFTVKKRQKVKLYITTKTSSGSEGTGKLKVSISSPQYRSTETEYYYSRTPKGSIQLYTIGNKGKTLDPGVYYVCISGYNYGNGYYTLKWK